VSLSGMVAVADVSRGPESGDVDVFVEPAGGWSGAVMPAARLMAPGGLMLTRAVVSGNTVAAVASTSLGSAAEIEVFSEPAQGWSDVVMPAATLQDSDHAQLDGTAISAGIVVADVASGRADVFSEPPSAWSGSMTESARLVGRPGANGHFTELTGPTEIAGRQVLSGYALFTEPSRGWTGDVRSSAMLYPASSLNMGPDAEGFSGGVAAMTSSQLGAEHNCPCSGELSLFTEPTAGWPATISAPPALATEVSSGVLAAALDAPTLFMTGGGSVDVYQITGSYGSKPAPPTLSNPSLTGVTERRPRLTFAVAAQTNSPPIVSIHLRLPQGLAFAGAAQKLSRGVYVRGITGNSVTARHHVLTIDLGGSLAKKTIVGVRAIALTEAPSLRLATVRAARHNQKLSERLTVELTDSLGETSSQILTVRT